MKARPRATVSGTHWQGFEIIILEGFRISEFPSEKFQVSQIYLNIIFLVAVWSDLGANLEPNILSRIYSSDFFSFRNFGGSLEFQKISKPCSGDPEVCATQTNRLECVPLGCTWNGPDNTKACMACGGEWGGNFCVWYASNQY